MVADLDVLAVVPARGGSKSIPKKNTRSFLGHPLLAYSIAAGLAAESVGRVVVSTEDESIAAVAREYGADVPFLRPAELAQDDSLDLDLFVHLLSKLEQDEGYQPEVVVQLRPTSPLRPPGLVDRAIQLLASRPTADSARGVVPSGQNPYKMWRLDPEGWMRPLLTDGPDEAFNQPRQALPPTFWQTGHIDVVRRRTILEQGSMSGKSVVGLEIDARYSVDIDTEWDWLRAEHQARQAGFPFVRPGSARTFPKEVSMVILDFDGVMTDDRVWVDAEGHEMIAAHRGDGWGIARLLELGVQVVVLSSETDPVVAARCGKLGIEAHQGILDKPPALARILDEAGVDPQMAIYVGNDANDVDCFAAVGWAAAPSDAHPSAKLAADHILAHSGGRGAVREVCDMLLRRSMEGDHSG